MNKNSIEDIDLLWIKNNLCKTNEILDFNTWNDYSNRIEEIINVIWDRFSNHEREYIKNRKIFLLCFYNCVIEIMFLKIIQTNPRYFDTVVETKPGNIKALQDSTVFNDILFAPIEKDVMDIFFEIFKNQLSAKTINELQALKNIRNKYTISHIFCKKIDDNFFVNDNFCYYELINVIKNIQVCIDKELLEKENQLINTISKYHRYDWMMEDNKDYFIEHNFFKKVINNIFKKNDYSNSFFKSFFVKKIFDLEKMCNSADDVCIRLLFKSNKNLTPHMLWNLFDSNYSLINETLNRTSLTAKISKTRRDYETKTSTKNIDDIEKIILFLYFLYFFVQIAMAIEENKFIHDSVELVISFLSEIMKISDKNYNFLRWNIIVKDHLQLISLALNNSWKNDNKLFWVRFKDYMESNKFKSFEYLNLLKPLIEYKYLEGGKNE